MRTCRTMMSAILLFLLMPVSAQLSEKVDLEKIYKQIDAAIDNSPKVVAAFEARIDEQKTYYYEERDPEKQLQYGLQVFELYRSFKNDSALYYVQQCVLLADSLGHEGIANRYRARMARQCSNAGMYVEALGALEQVDKSKLDRQGLSDYYDAYMHVCGEIAAYTLLEDVRGHYYAERDHYRDSLAQVADPGSDDFLHLRMSALVAEENYMEALKVSDQWINKVGAGSREDALASYYRHIVYDKLGNKEMVRYWLAKSALADITNAVMDQASLITLAHLINFDGERERSYKYIRFTWDCNNYFNTRMRSSQISPVLDVIEKNYKKAIDHNTTILTVSSIVFTVLSLLLLMLFYYVYRQKKKLAKAQQDLVVANESLLKSNEKLQFINEHVMQYNKDLHNELQRKNALENKQNQE